jgi:hypothetical protein
MTDKPIRRPGTEFIAYVPEGQPITMAYLQEVYRRVTMMREASKMKSLPIERVGQIMRDMADRQKMESLHAKMRRDATISVIKAKCGVR